MSNTLNPTIFIGIGSTGAEILDALQTRIYEEYQVRNFPLIQMLGFVTADTDVKKGIYDISWTKLGVPDTSIVKEYIKNPREDWHANLKKWLPDTQKLFHRPSFIDGSGGFRVAGRLHLWINYKEVMLALESAIGNISNSKQETERILSERYPGQDYKIGDLNKISVFIIGSLGGGSCSGMCIDMAFAVRKALKDRVDKVTGVFTIPCYRQATSPDAQLSSIMKNSYAAISELSYFFHYHNKNKPIKHYFYEKDIEEDEEIKNKYPYDDVYLESCANIKGRALLKGSKNDWDHASLCQMIGMSLALEVCSSAQKSKAKLRIDYRAQETKNGGRYAEPDPDISAPRAFCSFGATSIKYPKYSLARAAACSYLSKWLLDNYIKKGETSIDLTVNKSQKNDYLKRIANIVKSTLNKSALDRIRECFSNKKLESKLARLGSDEIANALKTFGEDGGMSLADLLQPNGEIEQQLAAKMKEAVDLGYGKLKESMLEISKEKGVKAANSFIEELLQELDKIADKNLPNVTTKIRFDDLNRHIDKINEIEKDWFHKFTLTSDLSIKSRKEQIAENYRTLIDRYFDSMRKPYTAKAIKNIRMRLKGGKGIDPISNNNKLINLLNDVYKLTSSWYEDILDQISREHQHEIICSQIRIEKNGDKSNWESEINNLRDSLEAEFGYDNNGVFNAFLEKDKGATSDKDEFEAKILQITKSEFEDKCRQVVDRITSDVMKRLKVDIDFSSLFSNLDAEAKNTINEYIGRANCYIEMASNYRDSQLFVEQGKTGTRIIFYPEGYPNANKLEKEFEALVTENREEKSWKPEELMGVKHWLLFYTEEPGFAPQHMQVWQTLESNYWKKNNSFDGNDMDWCEDIWRREPIDFERLDREKFVEFMFSNVMDFFPNNDLVDGNNEPLLKESQNKGKYYFYIPGSETGDTPIHVNIGNKEDYEKISNKDYTNSEGNKLLKYMIKRIVYCVDAYGKEKFIELRNKKIEEIMIKMENIHSESGKEEKAKLEYEMDKLVAFGGFLRKVAWNEEYTVDASNSIKRNFNYIKKFEKYK